MPNSWLLEKTFNGGLQETHYFNGRLLSADAFKADQEAVQTRQDWLGKAAGFGVIEGLVVRKVPTGRTKVSITAGLGLNYTGRVLRLPSDMNLDLGQGTPQQTPPTGTVTKKTGTFVGAGSGQQQQTTSAANTGKLLEGVYLLTILPATQFTGLAPMKSSVAGVSSGISNAPGCGSKWEVEGVQFKVIRLDSSDLSGLFKGVTDIKLDDQGQLRQNLLAHWCYGTLIVRDFGIHPFDFTDLYSPLVPNASYIPDLGTNDLPLAVFHWDGSQITFVDLWAARRRVTHPDAVAGTNSFLQMGTWKALIDDRRVAENQARFRQFQDQLDGIVASGSKPGSGIDLAKVMVTDFFTFLPPVGFLPVTQQSLQTLLCNLDYQQREPARPKEEDKGSTGVQLNLSEDNLRMLGEFAGGAAGALLSTVFPTGALIGTTGGILARVAGGIGSFLHLGSSSPAPGGQDVVAVVQDLLQRVQTLEGQGGQGQPSAGQTVGALAAGETPPPPQQTPPQQLAAQAARRGEPGKEQSGQVSMRERFHERLCITLSQSRTKPDGTARSKTEGFKLDTFFDGYLLRISLIGKDRVDLLMNESWYEDAIDLRPDRHPDPAVQSAGQPVYPVEEGLHRMPLLLDIYLVEENLLDKSQPLYVLFHKALHPVELIRYYKHKQAQEGLLPQTPAGETLPASQSST